MKKLIALLLVVLMIFSMTACGDKDPNLGKYNCVSSSMIGTENDWVELKKGGKGTFFSAFEFDMKWELDGENFTGTVTFLGMEETLEGTLKDGILTATIVNLSAEESAEVKLEPLGGSFAGEAQVKILGNGDIMAHNTFENPNCLIPVESTVQNFDGTLTLPQGAVAAVTVAVI